MIENRHIGPYHYELQEILVVTQKKVSNKETYTVHGLAKHAEQQIRSTSRRAYWKKYGAKRKFRYRVNIYLKVLN